MKTTTPLLSRLLILTYGIASYAISFAILLYAIGFLGNFAVPKPIDSPASTPFWTALVIDLGLLALFAVQHSVMARPAFKRWWTQFVPESAERSTYVLFSSLALLVLFVFWQPLGGVVWNVQNDLGRMVLLGLYAAGWLLVMFSTYLINHFDLFGLRQVWLCFQNREYAPLEFKTPLLYRFVRHPLYVGWFVVFWSTPTMTIAHLVFALMTTLYILLAIRWEERDLVASHPEYAEYRRRVPMLIPARLFRRSV